ncbi:hypothetical protein AGMMS49525_05530 [Bacteroidia bacterium]|nr:hypothetical protein AGMMS49525_05530 [Bacteroidia bacterium]
MTTIAVQTASAVPAVPWLIEKQLADGSTISYYLKGDEIVHWMQSPDGYTLLYNNDRAIVYATQDEQGDLVPSQVKYTAGGLRSFEVLQFKKGLRYSKNQIATLRQIGEFSTVGRANSSSQLRAGGSNTPVTGEKKVLCVLMGFPDRPFTKTVAEFENLMNQVGYSSGTARGSVKDFYRENSYGQMDMTVTVLGPYVTGQPESYYAQNRNFTLAKEAIKKADPTINFQDFAVAGKVESFHVIFAGWGAETGLDDQEYIFSYAAAYSDGRAFASADGVTFHRVSHSPELRGSWGSTITNIGVICHEMCHVFGAPDYYDEDYDADGTGEFEGSGLWDLMGAGNWNSGGDVPAHINMFQKTLFGWVTPTELTSYQQINNMPNSVDAPQAYTYTAHANGEMYVLENRQQVGFDAAIPGHGLLIWHVHQKALGGDGENRTAPQQLYPVEASSTVAIPDDTPSSYGWINSNGTPFPGSSGNTNFTDWSVPQAFSWASMSGIGQPITNIVESWGEISFTFMDPEAKNPHKNLDVAATGNDIQVKWQVPQPYLPSTLAYTDRTPVSAWSIDSRELTYAVRFTPNDIASYPGYQLTAVSYGILDSPGLNLIVDGSPTLKYTLCVWAGGNGTAPQTLIYDQEVDDNADNFSAGWHKIRLKKAVPIDSSKDLWFGIRIKKKRPSLISEIDMYPFACDAGPRVQGKGNWLFDGTDWDTAMTQDEQENLVEIDTNWALSASIEPIGSVQSYTIARNGMDLITSLPVNQTTYLDKNVPAGTYNYSMIAKYPTFDSNPIYGTISFAPAGITVVVQDDEMIRKVTVYNLQGGLVYRNNAVNATWATVRSTLQSYPCIVQVVTQQGVVKTTKLL